MGRPGRVPSSTSAGAGRPPAQDHPSGAHRRPGQRIEQLAKSRRLAPVVAVIARFVAINGPAQGGLLSVQFFTTLIPLMVIGFDYLSTFSASANVGDLLIRQLGLHPPLDARVREAFGDASAFQSRWSLVGIAGFLLAGIPMSIKVADLFARAWRRKQFGKAEQLARGAAWFALYLGTMALRERIGFADTAGAGSHAALLALALVPQWVFWSFTPALLVRDGGRGWRFLMLAGAVGVAIDGVLVNAAARAVFPMLLEGWRGFGPMGVALTLMTWCGVVGVGWVLIACAGAVSWERTAPARTVVEVRSVPDPGEVTE